jgi:hypothetical protein
MALLEPARRRRALAVGALAAAAVAAVAFGLARGGGDPAAAPAPPWDPGERRVTAEVLNGSGRVGLARQVTRHLRLRSVDVLYFGNADAPSDTTLVLVRRGDLAAGHVAARALGQGVVRPAPDTLLRVDVTVILGADYRPPPGTPPL